MSSVAQRQRRQAAKAARRKVVVAETKKLGMPMMGFAARLQAAARGPVERTVVTSTLFESGIGNVVIARRTPNGLMGCGYFLVDTFCLGVKDAYFREMSQIELDDLFDAMDAVEPLADISPERACKIVRESLAYAAGLGIYPPRDAQGIEAIFGDIDAASCPDELTFGQNGKPFYMTGPSDTPARIRQVINTLQNTCGAGNWDYMIGGPLG